MPTLMNEETTPLINRFSSSQEKKDAYSKWSITTGLILFVSLILSVLVRIPFNIFTFHPVFMTIFIVLATEGITLLQPTSTAEEKKSGLKYHAIIQSASYLSAITGFSFIFYNKVISGKHHFESFHGKLGLFVFIFLAIQLIFGIAMAFLPRHAFGSVERGKSLWKYHRVSGYILLVLVWLTSQLGVRADYMYNNLYSVHLLWLHWVAVFLVFAGIANRIRLKKWGIKQ
ncbi:eukaryotic cytochrome b561-domain-containing protein [Gilbertella persicaria]|uniref:eukaryotic cytochrome b561-domain-containing protein n=1 Tax=Gilbertella persicaria TaxID=101096 RepID=UPI00221F28AC|nr:eukaryotic cytochrome b561-domain-containing protein [Gilbertella persicaria]KAI8047390.1 eukaryotic cytochrome b561-domain-containing protein [Gilbertella persicaria]